MEDLTKNGTIKEKNVKMMFFNKKTLIPSTFSINPRGKSIYRFWCKNCHSVIVANKPNVEVCKKCYGKPEKKWVYKGEE